MHFTSLSLCALAALSSTLAAPALLDSILGNIINGPSIIPSVFQLVGPASADTPFTMTMHLNSANLAGLASKMEANAASLPDPMTMEEVATYATPSNDDLTAVQTYLRAQGFKDSDMTLSAFKDQITVPTTVGQVAKMFAASFSTYSFQGQQMPRAKSYTIPSAISNAVTLISPISSFVSVTTGPVRTNEVIPLQTRELEHELEARAAPASCNISAVTPTCLRNLYQTSTYTPTAGSGVDVFIAGFIGQNYNPGDLTSFLKQYRPDAASAKVPVINQAGALNIALLPGAEAMLDTETIVAATYPLKSTYYNYGNMLSQGDIFGAALNDIINKYSTYGKPGVYSVSYGGDESSVTPAEATALCNAAMKLTAMGTTIVLASGDNGVGGQSGDTCPPFVPTYPSGCQYILSVGATQNFNPEVAVDPSLGRFYSGSGFSNLYPMPSYQKAAVSNYISQIGTLDAGYYNKSGRAYPDVSAQGSSYVITLMGQNAIVSGTSASAPTMASIIALLNDARRKKGRGNVGWVNPFVYARMDTFTDITSGNSKGCGSTDFGFPVKPKWDPSTGVGTSLFSKLLPFV